MNLGRVDDQRAGQALHGFRELALQTGHCGSRGCGVPSVNANHRSGERLPGAATTERNGLARQRATAEGVSLRRAGAEEGRFNDLAIPTRSSRRKAGTQIPNLTG